MDKTINIVNTGYVAIDKQNKMKLEKVTFVSRSFKLDKTFCRMSLKLSSETTHHG